MREPRDWMDWVKDTMEVGAKVIVVFGAVLALQQYRENQAVERRRVAIEVIAHAKEKEVVEAIARLEEHYEMDKLDYAEVRLDIAYVMTWYDHLAMLYIYQVANRCVIKGAVTPYAVLIQRILEEVRYPRERRENFDLLVNLMRDLRCEGGSGGEDVGSVARNP